MRYHYEKPSFYSSMYGDIHTCDHPAYNTCTLYKVGDRGLSVIQQRFDSDTKRTWWSEIDPWLTDSLYLHPKFKELFDERSGEGANNIYRQIMWALKMKPLPKEQWETCFDRKNI